MTFNAKLLTATAAALIGAIALTGCNEAPAPAPAAEPAAQTAKPMRTLSPMKPKSSVGLASILPKTSATSFVESP